MTTELTERPAGGPANETLKVSVPEARPVAPVNTSKSPVVTSESWTGKSPQISVSSPDSAFAAIANPTEGQQPPKRKRRKRQNKRQRMRHHNWVLAQQAAAQKMAEEAAGGKPATEDDSGPIKPQLPASVSTDGKSSETAEEPPVPTKPDLRRPLSAAASNTGSAISVEALKSLSKEELVTLLMSKSPVAGTPPADLIVQPQSPPGTEGAKLRNSKNPAPAPPPDHMVGGFLNDDGTAPFQGSPGPYAYGPNGAALRKSREPKKFVPQEFCICCKKQGHKARNCKSQRAKCWNCCMERGHPAHKVDATGKCLAPKDGSQALCFECLQQGHRKENCPSKKCYLCLKPGHVWKKCEYKNSICPKCKHVFKSEHHMRVCLKKQWEEREQIEKSEKRKVNDKSETVVPQLRPPQKGRSPWRRGPQKYRRGYRDKWSTGVGPPHHRDNGWFDGRYNGYHGQYWNNGYQGWSNKSWDRSEPYDMPHGPPAMHDLSPMMSGLSGMDDIPGLDMGGDHGRFDEYNQMGGRFDQGQGQYRRNSNFDSSFPAGIDQDLPPGLGIDSKRSSAADVTSGEQETPKNSRFDNDTICVPPLKAPTPRSNPRGPYPRNPIAYQRRGPRQQFRLLPDVE